MIATVRRGYAGAAPDELAVVAHRPSYVSGEQPAVLMFHGAGDGARGPLVLPYGTGWGGEGLLKAIADRGRPVVSGDWGGTAPWANDTAMGRVDAGHTWVRPGGGAAVASAGDVSLVGASMGAATAVRWAVRNPTLVDRLALLIPALDFGWLFDNFPNHATNMTAAWGSRAAAVAQQPLAIAAGLPAVPVAVWYASNDDVYPPGQALATVEAFAALCPGPTEIHSLGAVGHTVQAVPSHEVAGFVYG